MKKTLSNIFITFVLCLGCIISIVLPSIKNTVAKAENSTTLQYLINREVSATEWSNLYGGQTSEVENFTPFDEESKTRMSGNSIVPVVSDNKNQINSVTYNLNSNGGMDLQNPISLGVWLYFYETNVHGLELTLSVDNENFVSINLSRLQMINLLKKNDGVNEQAFAWNYLEIPLSYCSIVGSVSNENILKPFKTVTISYITQDFSQISNNSTFSKLRFYGLSLHSSSVNQVSVTKKQDYTLYSFNFWDEEQTSNIIQGDKITSKTLKNAVNYAWIGANNLIGNNKFSWQIVVIAPSGKEKNYNFGEDILFEENGVYRISYKAHSISSSEELMLYDSFEIYVRADNLVYFDFLNFDAKTGATIYLTLRTDFVVDVDSIDIISVNLSNNKVEVKPTENPLVFEVKSLKEGNTDLDVEIKLLRKDTNEIKTYTAKTTIVAKGQGSNQSLLIVLWISLGLCLLAGAYVLVKAIISARKNNVR